MSVQGDLCTELLYYFIVAEALVEESFSHTEHEKRFNDSTAPSRKNASERAAKKSDWVPCG